MNIGLVRTQMYQPNDYRVDCAKCGYGSDNRLRSLDYPECEFHMYRLKDAF